MAEFTFQCAVCRTVLAADDSQAGRAVRCPFCKATLKVPAPHVMATAGAPAAPPKIQTRVTVPSHLLNRSGANKRYGFNCGYCSSRLEATEIQAGQEGQCPTCGNTIVIPIQDRYGRLIDPITQEIIKQDPHPVHAYAAAGDRAPKILRISDGGQAIECPRCRALSPISANNCKSCGMPFTMEGTTQEASGSSNGFSVASLVLGILGIPCFIFVICGAAAIICGVVGYRQAANSGTESSSKGMAIAGIVLGAVGIFIKLMTLR